MDPLSSLSVASSAIQIFDFSSKLWKQIRELYRSESGATRAQETVLSDAERLCSLNSGLSKLLTPENLQRMLTTTEEDVVSLCNECDDAAENLVGALQELTLDRESNDQTDIATDHAPNSRKRKASQPQSWRKSKRQIPIGRNLDAVRIAIKGVWMKKDVDKLCERVETLKHSLASAILVNIQHGILNLDRKVDFLAAKPVKWANVNSFDDTLRSQNLDTPLNEAKLIDFFKAHISRPQKVGYVNEATETTLIEALTQGNATLEPWSATSNYIVESLIKKLSFSEMLQRQESIHDNFEGTFQWIYDPPRDVDRPWDSFATWLTEGRGIYWITGKAGSGKSTLMRMLHQNKRTRDLLRIWCSGTPLITASFFFWNSGSKMQMSQEGLLRSLLLQIFEQKLQQGDCDTLLGKLVAFAMTLSSFQDFQFKDLLQLFRLFVEDGGSTVKFFIILDGLDEFDGDKSKLVSLVHTLGTYDHIKLCISSRPWVVFEDGFRQQPSLVLQHLTHHDILHYSREKLTKEPAFREMSWADPSNASELIRSITKKASGVFLWVVLTVDSLIKGLADGDRVKDLEARLDEIPEELEDLFRKMLHGLEGRYFQDAARLFQIHRASRWPGFGGEVGTRLPLLVYGFADEHGADLDATSKWPPRVLTAKECFMSSVKMKRRINSRCNGLLEIDEPAAITGETWRAKYRQLDTLISEAEAGDLSILPTLYSYGHNLAKSNVQYLHRTVRDYLEAPDIWRSIESSAPTEGDDYWVMSLCLGYIMLWRNKVGSQQKWPREHPQALPHSSVSPDRWPSGDSSADMTASTELIEPPDYVADLKKDSRHKLENCLKHAAGFLPNNLKTHTRLLDALGAALFEGPTAEVECNQLGALAPALWTHMSPRFLFEDFLSLAAHSNLFEYVAARLSCLSPTEQRATASRLLVVVALKREQWLKKTTSSQQEDPSMLLFPSASDSPAPDNDWDVLGYEEANPSYHMMQVLMRHGADPDFQAYGVSARQVVDSRRGELASSYNFQKILESFDFARQNSGGLTRRAKDIFNKRA